MKKLLGVVALAGTLVAVGCSHEPGTDDNGTEAIGFGFEPSGG